MKYENGLLFSLLPKKTKKEISRIEDTSLYEEQIGLLEGRMTRKNIGVFVDEEHDEYPISLRSIHPMPSVMYWMGDRSLLQKEHISIVGPRKIQPYMTRVLEDLFDQLSLYSLVTVSGGAQGVDSFVHSKSLEKGVPTIVVLGFGLRYAMKTRKRPFLQKIVDHGGLLLSEFRLDQPSTHWTFPQRNKIIAGLGKCLFFPSAAESSGTLITVDFALKMGTDVYSVPHSIYDIYSKGSNRLLCSGKCQGISEFGGMLKNHFGKNNHLVASSKKTVPDSLLKFFGERQECTIDQMHAISQCDPSTILFEVARFQIEGRLTEVRPGLWRIKI